MQTTKYITEGITIMLKILSNITTAQCLTDRELFFKMNDLLEDSKPICYRTYQRYKAAAMAFGDASVEEQEQFDPVFRELYRAIQRNQIAQKENLYQAMMDAQGSEWHKYKWIMERKYPDMNLRVVTQQHLREQEMEQKLLERDLIDMGIMQAPATAPQKATPQVPMEKPAEQVEYEKDARKEVEDYIPEDERPAFSHYWTYVQQQWDKKNPITAGYQWNEAMQKKLHFHYQVEFALWQRDKKKWMVKMAA